MCYSEIFELCRQIYELRTDAAIMETALRAYEDVIEEHNDRIENLETELAAALQDGEP